MITAPFWAFSQGGVFAHMLSVLAMHGDNSFCKIKCAIIASGFAAQHVSSDASKYQVGNLSTTQVSLPSLHLIGEKDTSVRPKLSMQLANMFDAREIMEHEN